MEIWSLNTGGLRGESSKRQTVLVQGRIPNSGQGLENEVRRMNNMQRWDRKAHCLESKNERQETKRSKDVQSLRRAPIPICVF